MKLLLDTHTLLWFLLGDSKISAAALGLIADPNHEKLVSPASYWEIAIKISVGKYTLHQPFDTFLQHGLSRTGFRVLPIELKHAATLIALPFHHRDPFDRMLVAQAKAESLSIVSSDAVLDQYPIQRLW